MLLIINILASLRPDGKKTPKKCMVTVNMGFQMHIVLKNHPLHNATWDVFFRHNAIGEQSLVTRITNSKFQLEEHAESIARTLNDRSYGIGKYETA